MFQVKVNDLKRAQQKTTPASKHGELSTCCHDSAAGGTESRLSAAEQQNPIESQSRVFSERLANEARCILLSCLRGGRAAVRSIIGLRGAEQLFNLFQMSHMEAFTLISAL